ncbi:transcription elongation factor GreA [Candidatus Nomurabacteria bacterium]|nr:MAG: transcription elongation factor GreA [Candidatus Nomurabacteria bacterium]
MNQDTEYLTKDRKKELEVELLNLQTNRRKEILENLEYAKSLGDLSENAEYHQAREEQTKLEERISKIEHVLKESKVIEQHHSTTVEIGSTVQIQKKGVKDVQTMHVVGSEEADMAQGKISHRSPLGNALLGKKKNDSVSVKSPNGTATYTIIAIE